MLSLLFPSLRKKKRRFFAPRSFLVQVDAGTLSRHSDYWASNDETVAGRLLLDKLSVAFRSITGAIWFEFGNSGKLRSKFHTRAAMRFKVVDDKCVNYHTVFDSYNLLHPAESQTMALVAAAPAASHHHGHGGVKKFAKQYCAQVAKMGDQKLQMDPEGMKTAYAEFKSFFADTVTCSQDPYNPVIGYSLKDVSFDDCQGAGVKAAANIDNAELSQATCIEIIADEDKGTGAIWLEFGNSGKLRSKFHARGAMRFAVDDGKCTSYHSVFDSYNLLPHDESEALAASLPYSSNAIAGFLVLSVFAAAALAGVKMSQKKKGILLENEVLG